MGHLVHTCSSTSTCEACKAGWDLINALGKDDEERIKNLELKLELAMNVLEEIVSCDGRYGNMGDPYLSELAFKALEKIRKKTGEG